MTRQALAVQIQEAEFGPSIFRLLDSPVWTRKIVAPFWRCHECALLLTENCRIAGSTDLGSSQMPSHVQGLLSQAQDQMRVQGLPKLGSHRIDSPPQFGPGAVSG